MLNGNSAYNASNSNSFAADRDAPTLPWLFRVHVPGYAATSW